MSFTIWLGNTTKRVNSTYQPNYEEWLSFDAVWKVNKDLEYPVVTFYSDSLVSYPQWNMMYIEPTHAFYWITGITSVRHNGWEISGVLDPLGTYKPDILDTSAYIEYGFNQAADGAELRIPDTRQNISQVPSVSEYFIRVYQQFMDTANGTYILSAVGKNGAVTNYKLHKGDLNKLLNSINDDIVTALENYSDVADILKYFTANNLSQGSAISAIRNCTWLPFRYDRVPGSSVGGTPVYQEIYLGDFATGVQAVEVEGSARIIDLYQFELTWPVADWKRMNTQVLIYYPFVGTVAIPMDQCNDKNFIDVFSSFDCIQGNVSIQIKMGEYVLYTGGNNIGVPYAIGSSNVPLPTFASGAMTAIGGAIKAGGAVLGAAAGGAAMLATGGAVGGGSVGGLVGGVWGGLTDVAQGTMQALTPVVQSTGAVGGNAALGLEIQARVSMLYYPPVDDAGFQAKYGHPVMRVAKPVSGYCKTRGFSIGCKARMETAGKINALMDSGVFIE